MMDMWLTKLVELVNLLLGKPEGIVKTVLLAALAIAVFMVIMRLAGRAAGMSDCSNGPLVLAATLGLALTLAASVAASLYAAPGLDVPALRLAAEIGIPLVVTLVVTVPLQCAILRSRYVGVLIGFLSGMASALLAVMLVHAVIGAVNSGVKDAKGIQKRTDSVNEILGK